MGVLTSGSSSGGSCLGLEPQGLIVSVPRVTRPLSSVPLTQDLSCPGPWEVVLVTSPVSPFAGLGDTVLAGYFLIFLVGIGFNVDFFPCFQFACV